MRKQADDGAALLHQLVFAGGAAHQDGRHVPGIDVVQAAAARIHQAEKHAEIFLLLGVRADHLVQRERQHFQRMQMHNQRAQRGLQVAHHQRG